MTRLSESIVIRITGDSGDGVQLVGEQLTITAVLAGRDVRSLPDFPAEIRAPAGTVAGVSGFQLAMSDQALFTAGESLDVLVALNPAALKNALPYLQHGGLLILNEDSMQAKDWQKAGLTPSFLSDVAEHYQILTLPIIKNSLAACAELELTQPQAKKTKNFYVLGLVLWLFDFTADATLDFIEKKFKTKPMVLLGNKQAVLAGYHYAETLELSRRGYDMGQVKRMPGDYRHVTGVEAVSLAIATLATRLEQPMLVAGYPITPASAILHECAKLTDFGVKLFQAEDEISAIGACIGAAFAGHLAVTCTSGPGLDLKSESLGLAIVSELPLVLIDVQRAGPSTGMPTKTGQSDLFQALYGRHGEAPLPVLAPRSSGDCFATVLEAFCIAVKYMTPVIILMDAYLANAAEPWLIPNPYDVKLPSMNQNSHPKPFHREPWLGRSWNIPGTPGFIHQLGGLEKQGEDGRISYDAQNHQYMVNLRAQKILNVADDYAELVIEGRVDAAIVLVGWGSTYGSLLAACLRLDALGIHVALLHLRHLNPLPHDLGQRLQRYQRVVVAELNSGQLWQVMRARYLIDAELISQCDGQPFTTSYLVDSIVKKVNHESINAHA